MSRTPSYREKNLNWGEKEKEAKSDWLLKDTLQEITSFDATRLETRSTVVESSTDVELLCTYNWISSKPSSIYVPGRSFQTQGEPKTALTIFRSTSGTDAKRSSGVHPNGLRVVLPSTGCLQTTAISL